MANKSFWIWIFIKKTTPSGDFKKEMMNSCEQELSVLYFINHSVKYYGGHIVGA